MQSSYICVETLKTRGTIAQGERKYLLRVKTIMRSSLPSFSRINHNPQVPQWLLSVTKYYKTVWGQRADGVWGRFCSSSSSVNACSHFALAGQVNVVFVLLWNLGNATSATIGVSLGFLSPFRTPQHNFCSSCWAICFPCPQSEQCCCERKQQELLQSNAKYFLLSRGAECPALGRVRPLKSVDFPVLPDRL